MKARKCVFRTQESQWRRFVSVMITVSPPLPLFFVWAKNSFYIWEIRVQMHSNLKLDWNIFGQQSLHWQQVVRSRPSLLNVVTTTLDLTRTYPCKYCCQEISDSNPCPGLQFAVWTLDTQTRCFRDALSRLKGIQHFQHTSIGCFKTIVDNCDAYQAVFRPKRQHTGASPRATRGSCQKCRTWLCKLSICRTRNPIHRWGMKIWFSSLQEWIFDTEYAEKQGNVDMRNVSSSFVQFREQTRVGFTRTHMRERRSKLTLDEHEIGQTSPKTIFYICMFA